MEEDHSDGGIYDPKLLDAATSAIDRLRRRLAGEAPTLSSHAQPWLASLSGEAPPVRYFTHPHAFPMLLLPWWLEIAIRGTASRDFQRELVYATISGYYFVRLVDDTMDGRPPPAEVLPVLLVLHAEFQHVYGRLFPAEHAFWGDFFRASYEAAETASADAGATEIGRSEFLAVSARKVAGAKIAVAAVCHRHDRADLIEPWTAMVDLMGRWHQMRNDIFDWRRDAERGASTYFLAEAGRRMGPGASGAAVAQWVVSEGLQWGMAELDGWMDELLAAARGLGSDELVAYLRSRRRMADSDWRSLQDSLVALRQLSARLSASQRSASASDQSLRRA